MPAVAAKPRIEITKSALLAALSATAPVAKTKTKVPILSCVRWSGVTIDATDLDLWVTVELDVAGPDDPTPVCINAAKFSEIAKQLDAEDVAVEWTDKALVVLNGRDRYKLLGMSAVEYPIIPTVEAESFAIPSGILASALNAVRYIIATGNLEQSARPALQGVHLKLADGQLAAEATDGSRLARIVSTVDSTASGQANIPWMLIDRLVPLLLGIEADVDVRIGERMLQVALDGAWSLVGRLIDEKFPPTERLFKTDEKIPPFALPRQPWMAALSRARALSPALNNLVTVTLEDGQATLTSEADQTGAGIVRAEYTCDLPHEACEFNINAAYLRDALAHLSGDTVTLVVGRKSEALRISGTRNDVALVGKLGGTR